MIGLAMEYAEPATQIVAGGCRILVQSTLLIALGLAACGVLRRRSATLRSVVLRATLVAVVVCPVVSGWCGLVVVEIPLPSGSGGRSVSTPSARPAPTPIEPESWSARVGSRASADVVNLVLVAPEAPRRGGLVSVPVLYCLLSAGWGLGVLLLLGCLGSHYFRTRRLRRSAVPAGRAATEICRTVAQRMGLEAPPVLVASAVGSPLLLGILRPAVLLPAAHPNMANAQVFAHELAHVRRRDCLWNIVSRLLCALCWFQPLMWTLARRAEQVNEEACDDFVLSYVGQRRSYAWRLLDMAQVLGCAAPQRLGIGVVNLRSSLGRRVQRLACSATCHAIRTRQRERLGIVLLGGLAVVSVSLVGVWAGVTAPEQGLRAAATRSDETEAAKVMPLVQALASDEWQQREEAAIALAQVAGVKRGAVPALLGALADEQWQVRKAAAVALTTMGPDAAEAVAGLIVALADEEWHVRRPAAEALAAIGTAAQPAVTALSRALSDEEWQVRRPAARALAAVGPAAQPATPQLVRTLDDEQWHVRESAALALGAIGPEAVGAIPSLMKRLDDPEWRVRRATASALEKIAVGDRTAIPEVINALRDSEWKKRQAAAESLERLL